MERRIEDFIWLDWVLEKLTEEHGVEPEEAEDAFFNLPYKVRRAGSGKYLMYGRSEAGRYLFIVFVWGGRRVKVISARDMSKPERHFYQRKRGSKCRNYPVLSVNRKKPSSGPLTTPLSIWTILSLWM